MKPTAHPDFSCFLLDRDCEVFEALRPYADLVYDHFGQIEIPDGALVVVGRVQTIYNADLIRQIVESRRASVIFCNAAEGSTTIRWHMEAMKIGDLARSQQLPIITGGEMPWYYTNLPYLDLALRLPTIKANLFVEHYFDRIFDPQPKPYKFLFYNGRARANRRFLVEKFESQGLLNHAIWSCLEGSVIKNSPLTFWHNGQDKLQTTRPVQFLPEKYEVPQHRARVGQLPPDGYPLAKYHLFNGQWSDGELVPEAYWDTYFSVVTETVFDDPETFLTEKICKPIMIGHPWIAVANPGFYQSLRNMGFLTFHPIVDESFDSIQDHQQRIERIAVIVEELVRQDLTKFMSEVKNICYYNKLHFLELLKQHIKNFPREFFNFARKHKRN